VGCWARNRDWAVKNPELAHKVMVAYLKAARDLALDNGWKQERNIDLMVKYTGPKVDVIRRTRAHVLDANLDMDLAVLDSMQRLSAELGYLKSSAARSGTSPATIPRSSAPSSST